MCWELKSKNFSFIWRNFINMSHRHSQVLNGVEQTRQGFH